MSIATNRNARLLRISDMSYFLSENTVLQKLIINFTISQLIISLNLFRPRVNEKSQIVENLQKLYKAYHLCHGNS